VSRNTGKGKRAGGAEGRGRRGSVRGAQEKRKQQTRANKRKGGENRGKGGDGAVKGGEEKECKSRHEKGRKQPGERRKNNEAGGCREAEKQKDNRGQDVTGGEGGRIPAEEGTRPAKA